MATLDKYFDVVLDAGRTLFGVRFVIIIRNISVLVLLSA